MPNVYPCTWFKASWSHEGGAAYLRAKCSEDNPKPPRLIIGRIFQIAYAFDGETIYLLVLNADQC